MDINTQGENQVVYTFPKSQSEEVRFTIREFEKRLYADLRIWFRTKEDPEMRPSKKGLWVKPEQLRELEKGVRELAERASSLVGPTVQKPSAQGRGFPERSRSFSSRT